jgi:hypothetical protein
MEIIMQAPLLILILLAGFVGSITFVVLIGTRRSRKIDFVWEPMQQNTWPYLRRNLCFTAAERSFYKVLRNLVPDHIIFAKVRLTDLVQIKPSDHSYWRYFNSANRKHIDFVVCDPTLSPVLAIELDASSHQREDRHSDGELVDQVLAAASLPIAHVPAKRGYVLEEVRRLLLPHVRIGAPSV